MTIDGFETLGVSSQGMFPSILIGPGQNPCQDLLPRTPQAPAQPRPNGDAANSANRKKRKQTTSNPVEASSVGGYHLSPGVYPLGNDDLDAVCEALEAVYDGERVTLIITFSLILYM